uniref:Phospholipase A2 group IIF n=1 Tax=Phocoena sinus TaxID=42100 RepID=A0A8C9B539_PHOSS
MADGAQANPKEFRKKGLVRHPSGWRGPSLRASSPLRNSRYMPASLGWSPPWRAHPLGSLTVLPTAHSSLLNLRSMVEANTGRNAILSFVGYGCYCGRWGGMACPWMRCTGRSWRVWSLFDLGCHTYVDHHDYTIENNTNTVCSELNQTERDQQTCECDKSVVLCFQKQTYREEGAWQPPQHLPPEPHAQLQHLRATPPTPP